MIELTKEQVTNQIDEFKKELDTAYSSNNENEKEDAISKLDKAYTLFKLMDNNKFKKDTEKQQFVCIDISFNKDYKDKVLLFINNRFYLEDKDTYFENTKFETTITEKQLNKEIYYGLIDIESNTNDSAVLISNKITNCYRLLNLMKKEKTNILISSNSFIIFDTSSLSEGIPAPIICIDKRSELYLRNIMYTKIHGNMILSVEQIDNDFIKIFPLDSTIIKKINKFLLTYHEYPKEMEETWHD